MAYYLWTGNYTRKAVRGMMKNPSDREAAARKAIEAAGGKMLHVFAALGSHDLVLLAEFPDDVSAATVSVLTGAAGAVENGNTTRLMTMDELAQSIAKASKIASEYVPPQD
ncbi:MAG: GYD domain-containing protein [Hyphomicrobiales bacterium]